jgi:hypothetical protein
LCLSGKLHGLRKSVVLYQGTTLVGPSMIGNVSGFSPHFSPGVRNGVT